MAYGQQQNVWGARSNAYGDEEKDKPFGAGMGGNSIQAVGGGFKEKNTGKLVLKTAATIVGTIYGGPAGGAAAGMAVGALVPDKKSVKSGTSGFGAPGQKGGGSQTSMQQGGSSDPSMALAQIAAQGYDKYKAGQKAAGPLADPATTDALSEINLDPADAVDAAYAPAGENLAKEGVNQAGQEVAKDAAGDAATDGAGNALMYAKAAYDVSNKLNESGVMASEAAGGPTMNMDTSGVNMNSTPQTNGPLNPNKLEEEDDLYKKNMSAFAPLGGNR